jgi:RNA polymerase-interacting CarD/CdnL/TRCF family regulator
MNFLVGDQVVHSVYGLGEIIQLDEKKLSGRTAQYYVVRIRDLTLWVPINDSGDSNLRYPTPASDFEALFAILRSPGEPLSEDRLVRKTQLTDQIKDGKLSSVCRAVRDLTYHRHTKKMNENDTATLERLQNFLLNEWVVSLSISFSQAKQELSLLLGEDLTKIKEPINRNKAPVWRQNHPAS